jgi:PAS domain S-box-containing protein
MQKSDMTDDRSEMLALLESEERFRSMVVQSPLSIQILSPDGRTLQVNPAWERLWGMSLAELGDYNILEDEQLEDKGILPLIKRAFKGETCQIPAIPYRPPSGIYENQERWSRAFIYPVLVEGRLKQVILVHEDITERVAAELELRASELRFKELADSMPAIVWSSHADGRVDYLNRHYYEYTGLDTSVPGAEGWKLVVHPDDAIEAQRNFADCFSRGVVWEQELRLKRHDGTYRWHLSRSLPVFGGDNVVRWYATSIDIHEQKLAEQKAKDEAFALETINRVGRSLSSQLDFDSIVQAVTDGATTLVGAEFGAFFYNVVGAQGESYQLYALSGVSRAAFETFPMPRNTEVFNPTFQGETVVRSGDITQDPGYGKNPPYKGMPEGHLPVKSYLAVPVISRSGEVLGALIFGHQLSGVFTDRHEHMVLGIASQAAVAIDNANLYRRLTEMNAELEDRVAARTRELEFANREMEGFTYSVSHDLRTPLRAIMSTSMMLKEDYGSSLSDEALNELSRQAAAANKLADLIDDLLRLSRLSRQDLSRKPINLSEMVKDVFTEVITAKPNRTVTLKIQDGLTANVDINLFKLALSNLIENAVKFSPNGGVIECGKTTTDRGEAFFIKDTGIGFDQRYVHKIFLPFERLVLDEEFEGTGIGLANVKRIVERHGGSVWAQGYLGEGATFYFTLERPSHGVTP